MHAEVLKSGGLKNSPQLPERFDIDIFFNALIPYPVCRVHPRYEVGKKRWRVRGYFELHIVGQRLVEVWCMQRQEVFMNGV